MRSLFLIVLGPILISCSSLRGPAWKHSAVFVSVQRIAELKERVQARTEPTFLAWQSLQRRCDAGLNQVPQPVRHWAVPVYYRDREGHRLAKLPLQTDANLAYAEALCFRVSGKVEYAHAAVRLLTAWMDDGLKSVDSTQDSPLTMSYHFPAFIFAADLLRGFPDWSPSRQKQFAAFIREHLLPLNEMDRKNNHANWGVVAVLAVAAYTDDRPLFERAENRWKELVQAQIAPDGSLPLEICRSDSTTWCGGATKGKRGIWYTNFALMPTVIAAEILTVNGHSPYSKTASWGIRVESAFHRAAEWNRFPEKFPYFQSNGGDLPGRDYISYFEVLNPWWPDVNAETLLLKSRPLSANHSAPYLSFTHGGLGPQSSSVSEPKAP